jgi:hypothetical protein
VIARHGPACALALAAMPLVPAVAGAAVVSVDKACYASGDPMQVRGSGFTVSAGVALSGAVTATAATDVFGAFAINVAAPPVRSALPTTVALNAADQVVPAVTATVSFPVVRARFWSNAPVAGAPAKHVTWRFAGFDPGTAIYGHLRFRGRTVTSHRFGTPRGACGVLRARARRVPVTRLRAGRWLLKLDQSPRYSRATPGRVIPITIRRG